jgi:hypothetical protein
MQAPPLPLVPRSINFLGRQLGQIGLRPFGLGSESLLARAQRRREARASS